MHFFTVLRKVCSCAICASRVHPSFQKPQALRLKVFTLRSLHICYVAFVSIYGGSKRVSILDVKHL